MNPFSMLGPKNPFSIKKSVRFGHFWRHFEAFGIENGFAKG